MGSPAGTVSVISALPSDPVGAVPVQTGTSLPKNFSGTNLTTAPTNGLPLRVTIALTEPIRPILVCCQALILVVISAAVMPFSLVDLIIGRDISKQGTLSNSAPLILPSLFLSYSFIASCPAATASILGAEILFGSFKQPLCVNNITANKAIKPELTKRITMTLNLSL